MLADGRILLDAPVEQAFEFSEENFFTMEGVF